jgi:hypothetical protein
MAGLGTGDTLSTAIICLSRPFGVTTENKTEALGDFLQARE